MSILAGSMKKKFIFGKKERGKKKEKQEERSSESTNELSDRVAGS